MKSPEHIQNAYKAGRCNIGTREIGVRKKFLSFFLPLSVVLSVLTFYFPFSVLLWVSLLLTTFSALVLYNEIKSGFCVIFGFFSLHNFKELGNLEEVENPKYRKADLNRVFKIAMASMVIALVYTIGIHIISSSLLHHA
ncbi:MAG: hypothetical protein IPP51_15095 [Bacteroidetes bacterium]|nr:hypothetical protein [Bacteroidota bacterium]